MNIFQSITFQVGWYEDIFSEILNRIDYACMFMAALTIAADTGFRLAPDVTVHLPAFFSLGVVGICHCRTLGVADELQQLKPSFPESQRWQVCAISQMQ